MKDHFGNRAGAVQTTVTFTAKKPIGDPEILQEV